MAEFPSFRDLFEIGKAEVRLRNPRISIQSIDTPGSDVNITLGLASAVGEEIGRLLIRKFANLYFQTAEGTGLDRLAFDRFSITRKPSAAAVGSVTFSRPTTAAGSVFIAAGTRVAGSGVTFKTTVDATMSGLTASVPIIAESTGAVTNVGANLITAILDALPDATVTVNNPLPTAGGADIESDVSFRKRMSNFLLSLVKGTLAALEVGALTVPGVATARAEDALNPGAIPAGAARVFIADANGQASQALLDTVKGALQDFRAGGMQVAVLAAVIVFTDIVLHVTFDAGADTVLRSGQVKDAVLVAVNNLDPGETLTLQLIRDAVETVPQVNLPLIGGIVAPVGDVVPAANEIIRTARERIAFQ